MTRAAHEAVAEKRRQAFRNYGRSLARPLLTRMGEDMAGAHPETRIEACRSVIRAAAKCIVADGGEARAAGIVSACLEDIVPAWTGEEMKEAIRAKAERALAQAMKDTADAD